MLLQAQPSLQRLFQLLPYVWKLQTSLTAHPNQAEILDLTTEYSDAKHAQRASMHHLKPDMLWVSTALEWGPFCPQATVIHWAEAMLQVSIKACKYARAAEHAKHGIWALLMVCTVSNLECSSPIHMLNILFALCRLRCSMAQHRYDDWLHHLTTGFFRLCRVILA